MILDILIISQLMTNKLKTNINKNKSLFPNKYHYQHKKIFYKNLFRPDNCDDLLASVL